MFNGIVITSYSIHYTKLYEIVTALPFLLAVKTDGRAFGESASRQNRAVEVQCDAGQPQIAELIQNPLPDKLAQMGDTGLIQPRQRSTDGGDIRQALQSYNFV